MQGNKRCDCKHQNPFEYICTLKSCKLRRVICQSCAWDHRLHEKFVRPLEHWKDEITNDCVIQRINHIKTNHTQIQCLESFTKLAQIELVIALKKKCDILTTKFRQTTLPLDQTLDTIKALSQNDYSDKTILFLINDFSYSGINQKLDNLEMEAFKHTQSLSAAVIQLMDNVQNILNLCDHKPVDDLQKIQQHLLDCMRKADQYIKPKFGEQQQQHGQPQSLNVDEEEKDEHLNDFLMKSHQQKDTRLRLPLNNHLSQSSLNYLRYGQDQIKSERQSFYVAAEQRPDYLNANGHQRLIQQVQPMSTKSSPYNNVMIQRPSAVAQAQPIIQQSQRILPKPTYEQQPQQFYLSKAQQNQRRESDSHHDHLSKSYLDYSSQKK